MDLAVLQDMGVGLVIMVLAVAIGFALAIGFAVLLVQGRKLPPALTGAAVGLAAAGGTLTGLLEGLSWDPSDPEVMRIVALTTAAARLLTFFAIGPVGMTLLLGAAVAGARKQPRHAAPAVISGGLALLTAGVIAAGGYAFGDPTFTNLRAVVYAGFGVLVAIAMLCGGARGDNGAHAGAAAAISFPLLVAGGEGARRGLVELMMLMHGFEQTEHALRPELVHGFYAAVAAELPWSWATLGVACLVGVVGIGRLVQQGRRTAGVVGGIAWIGVAALIFALGGVGNDRMLALALASP